MFHEYPYQNNHELNLDWILSELNKFREKFHEWEQTITELQEALEDIDDWETRIVALETITQKIPVIEKALNDLTNLEKADVQNLKAMIDDLQKQINELDIAALKVYVDSHDNMLQADYNKKFADSYFVMYSLFNGLKERLEILAELVAKIDTMAFNPWTRTLEKESLQTNLNYAYADLADLVPTAEQYAELGLTATEYNTFDLLARDYSVFGKIRLKMHYVFSPVFGFKQELNNVLTSIVNYIKGTMSADEYTALDLTADEYTALDITALDYYSYNNVYGLLALGGEGLTAAQYATIHQI